MSLLLGTLARLVPLKGGEGEGAGEGEGEGEGGLLSSEQLKVDWE